MAHVIALYDDEDALARNEYPARTFKFATDGRWEAQNGYHPTLGSLREVYAEITRWHAELYAIERLERHRREDAELLAEK